MQDLQEENVDRRHRIENPLAPHIANAPTQPLNRVRRQRLADIGLELSNDFRDTDGHPWPPVERGLVTHPHSDRRSVFTKDEPASDVRLKLMPFTPDPFASSPAAVQAQVVSDLR